MKVQARANPDGICLFDSSVGELDGDLYWEFVFPEMLKILGPFREQFPEVKILYYSKGTHLSELAKIHTPLIDVLGVDWRVPLPKAFELLDPRYMIQGNLDPSLLFLDWKDLQKKLESLFSCIHDKKRWIFGLGHGVLPKTPEENVRRTVDFIHQQT